MAPALLGTQTDDQFYIFGNRETLAVIAKNKPEMISHFVCPTIDEGEWFQSLRCDWETEGITQWLELMRPSERTDQFITLIYSLFDRQPFDYIVCWGINFAVREAAQRLGVGFINMELGCSRTPYVDTLVADPWGANGASVPAHASCTDIDSLVPAPIEEDLYITNGLNSLAYEASFDYVPEARLLQAVGKDRPIAFIPLQLNDDVNMLLFSHYNSIDEVVLDVLPPLLEAGFTCVFKEHPLSMKRPGAQSANKKAKIKALESEHVIWLTHHSGNLPNSMLYKMSDLVVTVNSSSGFEALYYNKPVVCLGEAVWKLSGIFPSLKQFLDGEFDESTYKTTIGKLRTFFLKHYLIPDERAQDPAYLLPYLRFVGDLSLKKASASSLVNSFLGRA